MRVIYRTEQFDAWLRSLRDLGAKQRVQVRLTRLALGNAGDVRSVGGGVHELRLHHGPGYRVYFANLDEASVVLLTGGTKQTQAQDIQTALQLVRDL